jgi:Pyruvate/2-oxoacid:ferredoxin oxidoreductase gamma subunit
MFQMRFHGRGGRGVVTVAELLASDGTRTILKVRIPSWHHRPRRFT